jgi:sulfate/thiosulfate transport system substrate-binding protein
VHLHQKHVNTVSTRRYRIYFCLNSCFADWQKKTGETVSFKTSYAGSGSQTRAVINGLPADIVNLSLAGDVKKIEQAGLINAGWEKELPNNSIVTRSVVAIETRNGNPKGIKTWADLAKPGFRPVNSSATGAASFPKIAKLYTIGNLGGWDAVDRKFFADGGVFDRIYANR